MGFKYSEIERDALRKKLKSPDVEVVCPRCGETLKFKKIGNSCEAKCPTENCLIGSIRGL